MDKQMIDKVFDDVMKMVEKKTVDDKLMLFLSDFEEKIKSMLDKGFQLRDIRYTLNKVLAKVEDGITIGEKYYNIKKKNPVSEKILKKFIKEKIKGDSRENKRQTKGKQQEQVRQVQTGIRQNMQSIQDRIKTMPSLQSDD